MTHYYFVDRKNRKIKPAALTYCYFQSTRLSFSTEKVPAARQMNISSMMHNLDNLMDNFDIIIIIDERFRSFF